MGAVPIAAPITEVYPGLERGTMDGAMVPFTTILDFRLGEVAKGYTIAGPIFGRSVFLVAMNQKSYDGLPASARAAIDKVSGRELSRKATEVYIKRADQAVASVRGKADVYELPKAEQDRISKQAAPIIDEWVKEMEAKGAPAREMLAAPATPASRMWDRFLRVLALGGGAVLLGLMGLIALDVVMRYVLRLPFLGAYEMTELTMALIVFLGLPYSRRPGGTWRWTCSATSSTGPRSAG